MASPSLAAAAPSPLEAIPLASRPAAAAPRKRPVLLLDTRPHPASPTPPLHSSTAAGAGAAAAAAASAASGPAQARRKKSSHTPKPRWQTVLSVAAKNAALLAALLYLGDLAWRWSHPPPPSPPPRDGDALKAYAARVAELEASLDRALRMMQVQLEAIDRKIDGEVGAARADLAALLEEKRLTLEEGLRRLDARAGELGDALAALERMEFLRKEEFEKFWEEFKDSLASGSGSKVDLDQVRALAREIVMKEIEKHAADGIGRVDYAVASGGGRVVRNSEPYVPKRGGFLAGWLGGGNPDPQKMIQPSFGEPGQCFAVQGSSGFVEIKLKAGIIPEAVTLEHVSKMTDYSSWLQDVAYDRSTAPKDCRVYGWYDETPGESQSGHASKMAALAEFTYDLDKNNVQTFDVTTPDLGMINMIRFDFTSNHGSSLLTCIYRLRVHGHEPVSPGTSGFQA
ncbi:hypothetical protein HU200_056965 [Digitaria exilis]|uniref:SUN domain-containing protein n=1 Tax=Digitaria exilis TaxID=1010633 RepID=A0A835AFV7_9POAL|nr:hypothetical protein HU200_056965 [Digitaria exilis]